MRGKNDETDTVVITDDAMLVEKYTGHKVKIIKGDAKSVSIAAASIVAKVTRDKYMTELDKQYPGYGFAQNKGYGTAEHIKALKELGPTPVHRRSFIHNYI